MAIKFLSGLNLSNVTAGSILKLDSNGNIVAATAGTDYLTSNYWSEPNSGTVYTNDKVGIGYSDAGAKLHVYEYQTTTPKILIEDGNTGDASMQFKISTQQYTMGIDNSDADKFKISASSAFGTNDSMEIKTNGAVNFYELVSLPGNGTSSSREKLLDAHGTRAVLTKEGNAVYWQVAQGGNQFQITDAANGNNTKGNVLLHVSGNDADDNVLYLATSSGKVSIGSSTTPSYTLDVYSGTTNVVSRFKSGDNQAWISIQDDDSGTYGVLLGTDSDNSQTFIVADSNANKKIVLSGDKLGVLTDDPDAHLHVVSTGDNGSAGLSDYGFVVTSSSTDQPTLGAESIGDGYANLNLGSNIDGTRRFWHISKRKSTDSHKLSFYYYNGSGFDEKFEFRTDGSFFADHLDLPSGGQLDWANGDARIIEGDVSNYSLSFQTYTGSALTTKMFISSGGNIGMGTTDPKQKLHVEGNIYLGPNNTNNFIHSGAALGLQADGDIKIVADVNDTSGVGGSDIVFGYGSSTNTDSNPDFTESELGTYPRVELMRIDTSADRVGIGTSTPAEKLDVAGTVRMDTGITEGTHYVGTSITHWGDGDTNIAFSNDDITFKAGNVVMLTINENGTQDKVVVNSNGGDIDFRVEGDTDENLFFTDASTDRVGMGTASPDTKLHLYQAAASPVLLTLQNYQSDINPNGTQGNFIDFKMTDGNPTFTPQARIGMLVKDSDGDGGMPSEGSGHFVIYTGEGSDNDGNGTLSEWFRVTDKGNVGIGTSTPSAKLHVSGGNILVDAQYGIRFVDANTRIYTNSDSPEDLIIEADQNLHLNPDGSILAQSSISMEGGSIITTDSNNALVLRSDVQHGQGDEDAVISFKQSTTEHAKIDQSGYMYATGFKTTTASTGFLKADGTVESVTFGTMASETASDYYDSDAVETYVAQELGSYLPLGGGTMTGGLTTTHVTIQGGSSQLVLKDTTDDDDHSILFKDNSDNTVFQIATSGDMFGSYAYGTRPITFKTGGNSPSERLRITSDGKVGIGTSSPNQILDISGSQAKIRTSGGGWYIYNTSDGFRAALYDNGTYTGIFGDGTGSSPYIALNSDKVGIGTTTPSYPLDVVGDIYSSSRVIGDDGIGSRGVFRSWSVYSYSNGILIETDIDVSTANSWDNRMVMLSAYGMTYSGSEPPTTAIFQLYNYNNSQIIIPQGGISTDENLTMDVFHYNGKVYFHMEQTSNYQTWHFELQTMGYHHKILSISNLAKPSTGVTNSHTITPKTSWHSGNDGSGSGLDADTVDGLQASAFLRSDTTDTASGAITFTSTSLELSGHYYQGFYSGTTNYIHFYPDGHSGNASVTHMRAWTGSSFRSLKIQGDSNNITWGSHTLWTSGNDGSGSGLDADQLDGVHASGFIRDFGTTAQTNINTLAATSGKYRWNNSTTGRPASSQSNEYGTLLHLQYDASYATQMAYDIDQSNLYIRHLALATDTGSTWKRLLTTSDSSSFATSAQGTTADNALPRSGGTMTGDLRVTNGDNNGIRFHSGGANITSVSSGDIVIQRLSQLRLGDATNWDWNKWAGIMYNSTSEVLYIGGPSASQFSSNSNPPSIDVDFVGVDTVNTPDLNVTGLVDTSSRIATGGQITVNNRTAISVGQWAASSSTTGAIRITLPGSHSSNWSMIVLRITAYEYNSTAHTIYYVSGHDWTSGWYNNGVTKIGNSNKDIKLGYDSNKDYVILGGVSDTWSYGHVTVDVMAHPSFYSSAMDISSGWDIRQVTDLTGITTQSVTNKRVLTTSDEGSGNGIDADKVDGLQASSFLRSDTSDEMSGTLTMRNNVSADGTIIRDINFNTSAANGTDDRIALVRARTQGGTSTTRGGRLSFYTRNAGGNTFHESYMNHQGDFYFANNLYASSNKVATESWVSSQSYATLASPALTGTPTAPTAAAGTNTTQIATTAFVSTAVSNLVDSAPGALNTLNELAAAIGDDANFSTTITNSIAAKLPLAGGTLTGSLTISSSGTPKDILIYGNSAGEFMQYDGSASLLKVHGKSNATAFQVFTNGGAVPSAVQLQVGRSTSQYWGVLVNDAQARLIHRQDETGADVHQTHFELWSSATGTAAWKWFKGNNSGGSLAEKMALTDGGVLTLGGGTNTITNTKAGNWDTAYGWGNHASANYASSSHTHTSLSGTTNDVITLTSTKQTDQGSSDPVIDFVYGSTSMGKFDASGYLYAAGFKTSGTVGFLRSDGTVDTNSYANAANFLALSGGTMTGDLTIPSKIIHSGDTNTYFQFNTDEIALSVGGASGIDITTTAVTSYKDFVVAGGETLSVGQRAEGDDNGRTVLIEGTANGSNGEGSGRIFFTEHNSTSASADKYGLSLYYEGDPNAQLPSGFQPNTGNATWSLRRHANSVNGTAIMSGSRDNSNVLFAGNITTSGVINVPEYIYHNGDSNTYIRFTADRIRIVAGGSTKFDSSTTYLASSTDITVRRITARDTSPESDRTYNLGTDALRWAVVFCETLDSAGQHESNLQDEEQPISQYATGTVLSWKDGKNRPCTQFADHMRMGIAVEGQDSPLVQGAEPVLCTGVVEEGDYLVTSDKEGHAVAVPRNIVKEQMLFDCVIGKALENGDGESHLVKTWINI